jgi:hypothetical protein
MKTDAERKNILTHFVNDKYEQIICDKCMMTFLTNVYDFDPEHVLLEKRSFGLEYFCEAIKTRDLKKRHKLIVLALLMKRIRLFLLAPQKRKFFQARKPIIVIFMSLKNWNT